MYIFLILIGLFVIVFGIYLLSITLKVRKSVYELTHPIKYNYDNNSNNIYTYKKFEFLTNDGVKLSGIDYQPQIACKGTILVCHFLGGSKEAILLFVEPLLMNGYRILSFDNRNHGESEICKGIKNSLLADFTAFYKKIKTMGITGPFGIMGFSMGASQAIWAANKYDDVRAIISDSGPMLFAKKYFNYVLDDRKIKNPIHRNIFLFVFLHYVGFAKITKNTIRSLANLKGKPILLIHGERDNIMSIDNPKLAYKLLKSDDVSLWCIPRSRHLTNRYINPKEYDERIVAFFDKNIAENY